MIKRILKLYFNSWWLPALIYIGLLGLFMIAAFPLWAPLVQASDALLYTAGPAFAGLLAASVWHLIQRRWGKGLVGILLVVGCGTVTLFAAGYLMFASMFGPDEDGFADHLTIPAGLEIAEPETDSAGEATLAVSEGTNELQAAVRQALSVPGGNDPAFVPAMPSLRRAATDHAQAFRDYIEASPDWHVFIEQGNRFAVRRWSYGGEPQDTLHGYISEFSQDSGFQTRCLLCLDRRAWSRYSVQHAEEGPAPVKPEMSRCNNLHESRVMIECGGVWVELFEQSGQLERRVTKATVTALEKEFLEFEQDPQAAVMKARARSRALAKRIAGADGQPFRLLTGMQPGIYGVAYSLNPGEPGWVYLKAFEVTQGTPLSAERLEMSSRLRMTWSEEPSERFGAKAGFTIYEGDWGKPYAARFEVWFQPDSGKPERKLAERIFRIEGWQR